MRPSVGRKPGPADRTGTGSATGNSSSDAIVGAPVARHLLDVAQRLRCATRVQRASAFSASSSKNPNRMRETGRCSRICASGSGSISRRLAARRNPPVITSPGSGSLPVTSPTMDRSQRFTVGVGRSWRVDQDTVTRRHPRQLRPLAVVGHDEPTAHAAPRVVPGAHNHPVAWSHHEQNVMQGADTGLVPGVAPDVVHGRKPPRYWH